jgi:segregation and condensation protein A
VREQAVIMGRRLRRERVASFRSLVADADSTLVVVARFLALLELFRESAIGFEQAEALGELTVRWTGTEEGEIAVGDDFDDPHEAPDDDAAREKNHGPEPDQGEQAASEENQ